MSLGIHGVAIIPRYCPREFPKVHSCPPLLLSNFILCIGLDDVLRGLPPRKNGYVPPCRPDPPPIPGFLKFLENRSGATLPGQPQPLPRRRPLFLPEYLPMPARRREQDPPTRAASPDACEVASTRVCLPRNSARKIGHHRLLAT